MKSAGTTKESWKESVEIQNRAADKKLALPVYAFGTFESVKTLEDPEGEDTQTFLFMITLRGDPDRKKCHDEKRSVRFFIDQLSKIDVVHADLGDHLNNILCYKGTSYLIDFEEGHDTTNLKPEAKDNLIDVELFCSIDGYQPGKYIRNQMTLYQKAQISMGMFNRGFYSPCWCRQRSFIRGPASIYKDCSQYERTLFGKSDSTD